MVDEFSSFARMPKAMLAEDDLGKCVGQVAFLMRVGHPEVTLDEDLPSDAADRPLRPAAPVPGADQHRQERHRGRRRPHGDAAARGARAGPRRRQRSHRTADAGQAVIDVVDNGKGFPAENRQRLARALHDDAQPRAPASASRSSPRSWRITAAASNCSTRPATAAPWCACTSPSTRRPAPPPPRRPTPSQRKPESPPWPPTSSSSTTKPTSANSCRASCRTRATAPATAKDADDALSLLAARRPHLMFLDIWLQGSRLDGLQLLEIIKEQHPTLPVVMISGHGNIETAVSAIRLGAYDFIEKPFKADRLVLVAERALETSRLKRENVELKTRSFSADRVVGRSTSANQLRQVIDKVGPANSRVLIAGALGHRQGAGGADDPRGIEPRRLALRGHQRRHHAARGHGDGAVRRRGRGGARPQGRRPRGGARRHALHRRGGRHAARDPEPHPARAGRPELPARRRHGAGACRRPDHLVDRARPAGR